MGIALPGGAQRPADSSSFGPAQSARLARLQTPWLTFLKSFQAAFRASTGRTIGTSPGLSRGGGIAERCAGIRPK